MLQIINLWGEKMRILRDMKIGQKLLLGFTILMLFKISLGIYSYFLAEDVFKTMDNIRVIQEQQNMFDKFRAGHNNNLYVAMDMINTGKATPQRPQTQTECLLGKWYYGDFQKYSTKQINEGVNSRYSEEEIRILNKLEKPHTIFHQSLIEVYEIIKKDNSDEGKEKALKVFNEITKPAAETLMSILGEYNETASKRATARRSYALNNINMSMVTLIITIVIMLLLSVIITRIITKNITRTVSQLSKAFEKITGGDLTSRIHMRSKDEGGYLGDCFNKMAEELSQMMSEINVFSGNVSQSSSKLETISDEFLSSNEEFESNLKELGSMLNTILNSVENVLSRIPTDLKQMNDTEKDIEANAPGLVSDIKEKYNIIRDCREGISKIMITSRQAIKLSNQNPEMNVSQINKIKDISSICMELSKSSKELREKISIFKV